MRLLPAKIGGAARLFLGVFCLTLSGISSDALGQDFSFIANDTNANYVLATGEGSFLVGLSIAEAGGSTNTQGFQMAFTYDNTQVTLVDAIANESAVGSCTGGAPEFFTWSDNGGGVTLGCLYELTSDCFRTFGASPTVVDLSFQTVPAQFANNTIGATTTLTWMSLGSDPAVDNIVDVNGTSGAFQQPSPRCNHQFTNSEPGVHWVLAFHLTRFGKQGFATLGIGATLFRPCWQEFSLRISKQKR